MTFPFPVNPELSFRVATCQVVNGMQSGFLSTGYDGPLTLRDGFGMDSLIDPLVLRYMVDQSLLLIETFLDDEILLFTLVDDHPTILESLGCCRTLPDEPFWKVNL